MPHHPGGALIHLHAGHECSALFDSYHPLYVQGMLAKFCIGQLREGDAAAAGPAAARFAGAPDDLAEGAFYRTLKGRVEAYFKQNKLDPQASVAFDVKAALIVLSAAALYYAMFFSTLGFAAAALAAVAFGFIKAQAGVSIQHDANHGAVRGRTLCALMAMALDVAGASSFMWRQQHNVGHHPFTKCASRGMSQCGHPKDDAMGPDHRSSRGRLLFCCFSVMRA